jgi:hypothetical protein
MGQVGRGLGDRGRNQVTPLNRRLVVSRLCRKLPDWCSHPNHTFAFCPGQWPFFDDGGGGALNSVNISGVTHYDDGAVILGETGRYACMERNLPKSATNHLTDRVQDVQELLRRANFTERCNV